MYDARREDFQLIDYVINCKNELANFISFSIRLNTICFLFPISIFLSFYDILSVKIPLHCIPIRRSAEASNGWVERNHSNRVIGEICVEHSSSF